MAIPKIEAFSWLDNHVVASSFLAPILQPCLINRPDPYVFVIFLLSLLYCRSCSTAADLLVLTSSGRCINLTLTRKTRRISAVTLHL